MVAYPNSQGNQAGAIPVYIASGASAYKTVAASQTKQVLGATGAIGDVIDALWVYPATTGPGTVILYDGNTAIATFTGGVTSVTVLEPFQLIFAPMISVNGAWSVTTGADVSAVATGIFT